MKLELKHLAPYLPYRLKIKHERFIHELKGVVDEDQIYVDYNDIGTNLDPVDLDEIQPILRPLSNYKDINSKSFQELNCDISEQIEIQELAAGYISLESVSYRTIKIMAKNHIDFNRLIEKGLAIGINTIKEL